MPSIISVDPFRCRLWSLHDRMDFTAEDCRQEIESVAQHGQLVPALGRTLRDQQNFDVELIFGARRLFIAQHLKKPLLVELREMSDRDAMVAMDVENRLHKDISPYERGRSFARYLRSGEFKSQEELTRALSISRAQLSRLLALARLPAVIVGAFADPREICETWGVELLKALDDPNRRQLTLERARRSSEGPPRRAAEVFNDLIAMTPRQRRKESRKEEIVHTERGAVLFRIHQKCNELAIFIPSRDLSPVTVRELRTALDRILTPPP